MRGGIDGLVVVDDWDVLRRRFNEDPALVEEVLVQLSVRPSSGSCIVTRIFGMMPITDVTIKARLFLRTGTFRTADCMFVKVRRRGERV